LAIEDKANMQYFCHLLNVVSYFITKQAGCINSFMFSARKCLQVTVYDWLIYRLQGPYTRVCCSHDQCSWAMLRKSIAQQCFFYHTDSFNRCPIHTSHVNSLYHGLKKCDRLCSLAVNMAHVNQP